MKRFLSGLSLLLFVGMAPVLAHPHVFINNKMTVLFDGGMLQGISFQWTFDDMFSSMILMDYDPKGTGRFDEAHVKALKEGAFDNLAHYHYFVAMSVGAAPVAHFKIERFMPSVTEKKKLVYSFFIPLKVAVSQKEQSVRLTVYDDTYFVAFDLLHLQDVTVTTGPDVACTLAIEKTKVKPQWPGQYMPDQLVIRFKGIS
jgi:ABC-type uncharacterized transport system substrate-binding protein